jgi:hypothetical protein
LGVQSDGATDWSRKAALLGTGRSCEAVYKHYKSLVANGSLASAAEVCS